jgi:hypothetical protein
MATKRTQLTKLTKDQLIEKFQEVEAQVSAQASVTTPAAAKAAKEHATSTRATVQSFSLDTFVADLQQKVEQLKAIQDAIEVETAELDRLYQLDVVSATTQSLIAEHQAQMAALEVEQARIRNAWSEEADLHTKAVRERDAEAAKVRAREQADYDYTTKQTRAKAEDSWLREMSDRRRSFDAENTAARAEVEAQAKVLSEREASYNEAAARIANLDAEIKAKVDATVAIVTNSLKKDLTNQFTLEKKDLELANRLEQQRSMALAAQLADAQKANAALQAEIAMARNEVRDIAKSAVEGASGQLALSKVTEMYREGTTSGNGRKS